MGEELSADDLTTLEAHARQLFLGNFKFQRIQFLFAYFLHRHKHTSGTYEMFISAQNSSNLLLQLNITSLSGYYHKNSFF